MLQSNILPNDRLRSLLDPGTPHPQDENGGLGHLLTFVTGFLKRRYSLIIFTTVLCGLACVVYLRTTPPTYTAYTKVLFGSQKAPFVQQQALLAEAPIDNVQIQTQLQIIKSKAIASAVISKLNLTEDPDFKPSTRLSSTLRRLRSWLSSTPYEIAEPEIPADDLVGAFGARLTAERVMLSNVIEIGYSSSSAERAAEIANAVANTYIVDQLNAKFEANRSATAWLQERLRELGQQALAAERAVNAFKSENNIVVTEGKLIDEQQTADLSGRLVAARAQTSDALARMNRFEEILRSQSADASGNMSAPTSEALANPIINNLRQQYLELSRRQADWSVRFGKDHLAVINLRNRLRDIRTSIFEEVRHLAESSKSDLAVTRQKQEEIEKQLAQTVSKTRSAGSAELTMKELEASAKSYRSLHESFLQRYMGSVQQETFPTSDARVISPASSPPSKSKPKTTMILAIGVFGGLIMGAALGFLRDVIDRVFRTTTQIETMLRLPCLSLVPLVKESEISNRSRAAAPSNAEIGPRTISRRFDNYWIASTMPLSRFAESIRAIKLAVDLTPTKASNKVVGITSALPNEGKSTLAASLAQLIAHAGKRVILVDCDLRNPSLSAHLAPTAVSGLIEVLSGTASVEETTWQDTKTNLVLLPVAKRAPLYHTSEILSAEQTRKLFDKLRADYDYVIVDLPPLAPIVDVRATTPLIDCFVLVVEWGKTKIDVVQHALHTAPNVHEALIGAVLNKTDMNAMRRYDNYHNEYYNNEHYSRYGYTDKNS